MANISTKDLDAVVDKLENGTYTSYFFLPDFEKESGGVKLTYDHVRCMNNNGFNAVVIHQKDGFKPKWLEDYYPADDDGNFENIPMLYLDSGNLPVNIEDFFFIPEGFPNIMENLAKQNAPCKRIVFCQNWYYVLNALPPGVFWPHYGITDVMSVSNSQSDYLKMIMPGITTKQVYGQISSETFYPPEKMTDKKMQVAFIPSRGDGQKAHNVIKTFYALFPHFKFVQFAEIRGLAKDDYAQLLRESAFFAHFDEYSSWGTAPIEAYLSKTLVAGWDGVGGREYMNTDNMWIVPNGDILRLAMALGNMVETYMTDEIRPETWEAMEVATVNYSAESEKDSIVTAHNEYRDERLIEIGRLMELVVEAEKVDGYNKETEDGE
jgi:hypothetical protein